ncbi:putative acyltransferase [Polaromonas sp. CF318]|uniref:acyltransferase family protein n=1 Tax=Polaromonas sp. CF318 TaxID=1144318 RepID=UPI00027135C6|nr:acyltransferase [Polaromonas sp. CF318]EJL79759.1 putative acyltransferase [Polaromonas sp. CF318]
MTKSQVTFLDLIRGLAAQLVLIGHVTSVSGHELKVTIQDLGVVLFFFLSGFLITTTAMKKDSFTEYFIDRFSRIFTAYAPCLCFILVVGLVLGLGGPTDPGTFFANLFMLQDYPLHVIGLKPFERLGTGQPLWSVAMEWWFYMGFGALFFMRKLPIWSLPFIAVGIYATSLQAVGGVLAFFWGVGAVAAVMLPRLPKVWWFSLAVFFSVLCLQRYRLATGQTPGLSQFYDLRLGLLMAAALFSGFKAVEGWTLPEWVHRASAGLASYSFTLYLTHLTVLEALHGLNGWVKVVSVFVVANLVAIAMYFAFERHHRTVREWIKSVTIAKAAKV